MLNGHINLDGKLGCLITKIITDRPSLVTVKLHEGSLTALVNIDMNLLTLALQTM